VRSNGSIIAVLAVLVVALGLGLTRLMHLRLERGDVYPPGSSLRVDPLGTRALAEALDSTPGIAVSRNFRDWNQVELDPSATFYVIAIDPQSFFDQDRRATRVLDFVASGGRLVFVHRGFDWRWADSGEAAAEDDGEAPERRGIFKRDESQEANGESMELSLFETWQLEIDEVNTDISTARLVAAPAHAAAPAAPAAAPPQIVWRDRRFFQKPSADWHTVYETEAGPVVLRRHYGEGEVIAMTDGYLFSNEALLRNREVRWLSWLQGPSTRAVFDEWHFGIAEPKGIAILIRRYQLGGFVLALALAGALFVWRNLYSLVPVQEESPREAAGLVRLPGSSQTGLRSLLKRAIAPANLLDVCIARFVESVDRRLRDSPRWRAARQEIISLAESQRTLAPRKRTPVAAYHEIARLLSKHRLHLK